MSDLCDLIIRKLNLLDREYENEFRNVVSLLHSDVKYDGTRICVPNLNNAISLLGATLKSKSEGLESEFKRIMKVQNSTLSKNDVLVLKEYINKTYGEELYINRYSIFVDGIERIVSSYGLEFDREKYRTNFYASLYEVSVKNTLASAISSFNSELELYSNSSKALSSANEIIDLKPNFMGLGVNLNALISRLCTRKKGNGTK
ncbi:hypothetical protein ACWX0P_26290 [Vibrio mediterranei]